MGPHQRQFDRAAPLAAKFEQALALLLDSAKYAQQTSGDPWEFAVEIRHLLNLGLTENDLRFLVRLKYLQHASEVTPADKDGRQFHATGDLSFTDRTCFVLTTAGAAALLRERHGTVDRRLDPRASIRLSDIQSEGEMAFLPSWDAERRALKFAGRIVKQFRRNAVNQIILLATFEEEGWPERIDDPLPPVEMLDIKRRLNDTIKSLNHGQRARLIHFGGDGTGEGVVWEIADHFDNDGVLYEI
jgi:hypothetical protein